MSSVIEVEPLRTILRLEQQRSYSDTSVLGGLDKFLLQWSKRYKRKLSSTDRTSLKNLGLSPPVYSSLDKEKRKLWVKNIIDWLAKVEDVPTTGGKQIKSRNSSVNNQRLNSANSIGSANSEGLDAPITTIKGIKNYLADRFNRLGAKTIRDLLYFFPKRYLDYSQRKRIAELKVDEDQTILADIWESRVVRLGGREGTEVTLADESGNIRAVWFNQPYLAKKFTTNARLVISGKVSEYRGHLVFESPEWELVENKELVHAGRLVPVYPLTSGLYPRQLRNLMRRTIDEWSKQIQDFLPQEIKQRCQLLSLPEAIEQIHFPHDYSIKYAAQKRLAFDEFFLIQLGFMRKKRDWQEGQPGRAFVVNTQLINRFLDELPFKLTHAQEQVLREILFDLKSPKPMSRLLQGDVGSGKTVIAVVALLAAIGSDYQGALMAPTEILAEQHYSNICQLLSQISHKHSNSGNICYFDGLFSSSVVLALLVGKMSTKEKSVIQQKIQEGEINVVIGTHALIQKNVEFSKLGLAVVDEQHRFGVLQRSALRQKGFNPHVLVMTATPIPRTLALTLYGDLDISVIDEMPPGRQLIKTHWLRSEQRNKAYSFIRREINSGRQAFIICPLIEESDNIEAKAAVVEYDRLSREIFPDLKLGLLHGRMLPDEKDEVMRCFRTGELNILVSTPVVEVGIDIPNATVILIEAAERFGLSQLHQFRGRVGRGQYQSYCLLLSGNPSIEGQERLKALETIHDGFALAEKDLQLRGPGEFFGTRQSGLPDLKMAKLSDVKLLELARNEAKLIFQKDPELRLTEYNLLSRELARVWPNSSEWS